MEIISWWKLPWNTLKLTFKTKMKTSNDGVHMVTLVPLKLSGYHCYPKKGTAAEQFHSVICVGICLFVCFQTEVCIAGWMYQCREHRRWRKDISGCYWGWDFPTLHNTQAFSVVRAHSILLWEGCFVSSQKITLLNVSVWNIKYFICFLPVFL